MCVRATNSCTVDIVTRTNCRKCRMAKCLEAGMKANRVDMVERKSGRVRTPKARSSPKDTNAKLAEEEAEAEVFETHDDLGTPNTQVSESSEASESSGGGYDMSQLVDDCFMEMAVSSSGENSDTGPENSPEIAWMPTTVYDQNIMLETNSAPVMAFRSPSPLLTLAPVFDLTFEEEFRIQELVVRKEALFDTLVCLLFEVPQISKIITDFLSGGQIIQQKADLRWSLLEGFYALKKKIMENLEVGGRIRSCIDMFDEYKNVDETVKTEIFAFSLKTMHMCTR